MVKNDNAGGLWAGRPTAVDSIVAVATLAASLVNLATQDGAGFSGIPPAGYVLLAVASVALLWRRRFPISVLLAALVVTVLWTWAEYPSNPVLHILVSLYAVGRFVQDWRSGAASAALAVAVVALVQNADGDSVADVATAVVLTALPWYVGRRVRARSEYAAAERARVELLEWKRIADAQRIVDDARAAIARELHDVVAHTVSLMTAQAGMARLVVRDDPDKAAEAIGVVEDAGRRTLDELRHLLGVLRPEVSSGDFGPRPGLGDVTDLADRLGATGIETTVSMSIGSDLPDRVDLFAYRIVQEALTNVLKHGGPDATARVRIDEVDEVLEIEVTDTGAGVTELPGAERGLVGMRERAVLLGGTFEAGPRLGGGFRVVARIPVESP